MVRLLALAIILLLIPAVQGLGIASDYLPNDELYLKPGQSVIYGVRLQNGQNETIKVAFNVEGSVAKLIKPQEYYELPGKSYNTRLYINISIPPGTAIGSKYPIVYYTYPYGGTGSLVGINARVTRTFTVHVGEKESGYQSREEELAEPETALLPTPRQISKSSGLTEGQIIGILLIIIFLLAMTPLYLKIRRFRQKDIYKFK